MAQTKTKPAKRAGASRSKSSAKSKSGSRPKRTSKPKAAKAVNGASKSAADSAKAVRETVESAGKDAGHVAAQAASKAKLPLIAGGAVLLGAAGGMALGASRSGGKVLGIKMPQPKRVKFRSSDLARAAKDVGHFGEQVGELTTEIKRVREGVGNGAKSSPIEVLLQGLTKPR